MSTDTTYAQLTDTPTKMESLKDILRDMGSVSYTHLTLPTKA